MKQLKYAVLVATLAVLAACGQVQTPEIGITPQDILENDVVADAGAKTATIQLPATTTTITYWIVETNNDPKGDVNKCNVSSASPGTLTITVPSGVKASGKTLSADNKLTFTACGTSTTNAQSVTFTSEKVGEHSITASMGGGVKDSLWNNQANFTLKVVAESAPTCTAAAVTTEPTAQSITYGANTSFTAAASGTPAPTVQWQVLTTASDATWTNITGATSATLELTRPAVSQSGNQYQAVFTNTCSGTQTATSAAVALTVAAQGLTIKDATASNKTYDGATTATVSFTGASLVGVVGNDTVTIDSTNHVANFDDKNIGNTKTVTVTGVALAGAQAGNYTVSQPGGLTANINPRSLTVSAVGTSRAYDGTTSATVTLSTNKVSTDDVTATYTAASFADKNVGTAKTVSVSGIAISGTDAGNYTFANTTTSTTASITALGITGSFTAADKSYDGNTSATVLTRLLSGNVSSDDVTLTGGTATFNNASVGTGKTVTLSGASLLGDDAGNYTLSSVSTTTASITAWTLNGFHQPIGISNTIWLAPGMQAPTPHKDTVWQVAKGGSTIPLKFNISVNGVERTNAVLTANGGDTIKSFNAWKITCPSGTPVTEGIEELSNAGSSSLRYADGQYIQNWKTSTVSGDTCFRVALTTADDSAMYTFIRLRK